MSSYCGYRRILEKINSFILAMSTVMTKSYLMTVSVGFYGNPYVAYVSVVSVLGKTLG